MRGGGEGRGAWGSQIWQLAMAPAEQEMTTGAGLPGAGLWERGLPGAVEFKGPRSLCEGGSPKPAQ